jgi:hypothetical protein
MKFRIHFEVNGVGDSVDIAGKTIEEIRTQADAFMAKRNLSADKNNFWSEEID